MQVDIEDKTLAALLLWKSNLEKMGYDFTLQELNTLAITYFISAFSDDCQDYDNETLFKSCVVIILSNRK